MKALAPFLFLLITSFGFASPPHSESPVQLFDLLGWSRAYNEFNSRADTQALRDWIEITYDRAIQRPWGDDYWKETQNRWTALRGALCPALKHFCALPEAFSTVPEMAQIISAVQKPDVMTELRAHFDAGPVPFRISLISSKRAAPPYDIDDATLNWMVSAGVESTTVGPISIWGMNASSISLVSHLFLQVRDVETYGAGFGNSPGRYRFLTGSNGEIVLYEDKLRSLATDFAELWKDQVHWVLHHPDLGEKPTNAHVDEYMFFHFFRKFAARFVAVDSELQKKLQELNTDAAQKALARFKAERAAGNFAEEVYQHVTYEFYRQALVRQAEYFQLAEHGRPGLNLKKKVWESLLDLQAGAIEPELALFLTYLEFSSTRGYILGQLVDLSLTPAFFYEEIKAILDFKEFSQEHIYPHYAYALRAPELWDRDFLKNYAPEALAALLDPVTGKLHDLFSLPEAEQKRIFEIFLYEKNGEVRKTSLYPMVLSILARLTPEDAAALARDIHLVRGKEFGL